MPRGPVRASDVTHLALLHDIIECTQRFLQRSEQIPAMHLIEIDIVGIKSPQTLLNRREDVLPRKTDVIRIASTGDRSFAHRATHFCSDDYFVASNADVF